MEMRSEDGLETVFAEDLTANIPKPLALFGVANFVPALFTSSLMAVLWFVTLPWMVG